MSAPPHDVLSLTHEGRILTMTLNRPAARNALDTALTAALLDALQEFDDDSSLTVGVLTGGPDLFCSGMDLKEFAARGAPHRIGELLGRSGRKPLVAAIEGGAFGGGLELALLCDLLVVSERARLGLTEVKLGLFAAGGGLMRLPRRLPFAIVREMVLTGKPLTADRAHELHLVNRVTGPGDSLAGALELARAIAANAPLAVAASKQLLDIATDCSEQEFWTRQRPYVDTVFGSADAREGASAFAEKRPPAWSGLQPPAR